MNNDFLEGSVKLNPNECDEEICNYESGNNFYKEVLNDSYKILIIDDRESDDICSSFYSYSKK